MFQKNIRIMPLGDSITAGDYNLNGKYINSGGYREGLENLLLNEGVHFQFVGSGRQGPPSMKFPEHEGHPGWRIDQLIDHVQDWMRISNPQIVLLMAGTNDCVQNKSISDAPHRLKTLIDLIHQVNPKTLIVVANILPSGIDDIQKRILEYNRLLKKMIEESGHGFDQVKFVDMYAETKFNGKDPKDLIDGLHPSPQGYKVISQVWFNSLKQILHQFQN